MISKHESHIFFHVVWNSINIHLYIFSFLTRECAHAHERVIAIVDFSLGQSVGWLVGSVVNFRACAVNEF